MDPIFSRLAHSVAGAQDLVSLTRPLLELLEAVTGMESTYLTAIDDHAGVQRILFSRNAKSMQIPEGLSVPWHDTLCKRALDEGRAYTDDVSSCWGDSEAARALGIKTYLSQPVRDLDGGLFGTLCAASSASVPIADDTLKVLGLFAQLIAHQVERERVVDKLRQANEELSSHAFVDPLTGLPNRRALVRELQRMLQRAERENGVVSVAFIDLDGFKGINDRYGHEVGDHFLIHIAKRLSNSIRAGDLAARLGGDEFVVLSYCQAGEDLQKRLQAVTAGTFSSNGITLDYAGASVGVVDSRPGEVDGDRLLVRADEAMYAIKRARKAAPHKKTQSLGN